MKFPLEAPTSMPKSESESEPAPKRIRGGGFEEELYDEDAIEDDYDEYMDEPAEAKDGDTTTTSSSGSNSDNKKPNSNSKADTADTAIDFTDLSPSQLKRWARPPVPTTSTNHDIHLQWLDIDIISGNALSHNPNHSKKHVVGATKGDVPIIRVYGVTDAGNSIVTFIHGYTPYGYFALPENHVVNYQAGNKSQKNMILGKIRDVLNLRMRDAKSHNRRIDSDIVQGVQYIEDHKSIMGFTTSHTKFLKVYVSLPHYIPALKRVMEEGVVLPGISKEDGSNSNGSMWENGNSGSTYQPFECNVPFVLRFMIDQTICGAGWLTLPKNTYEFGKDNVTNCQMELHISYDDLKPRDPEGEWNKIAPLRILSMDIECQGRKGYFPEADQDPVIQIANTVTVYGENKPVVQNVFTLKGCLPIVGAQVICSEKEEDLLLKWRVFLQACDPDIITGYNVQNFDIPYILDRADALCKRDKSIKDKMKDFKKWGRIRASYAKMKETTFQSAAYGKRNNIETTIDGRVIFDMLPYMQRNHKLSSYTLNNVCAEFLGQQKEDVHHSIIADLQNGNDEDRHRLAVYCLKDAQLPQRLMDKLSVLVNYIEMARVTGVPVSFLISRGQQIKVYSMILRKCLKEKLLVPTLKKGAPSETGYEGATVLDPIKAYYEDPIATLDFASLYPSIMQAYNLCYSTIVNNQDAAKMDPKLYKKSDNGHIFVHSHVKKGILPTILGELLAARKRAKKDMKNAPTEFEKAVQNGRQLALKVSANSVYGFTGAGVGQLPCLPIASSVTSYGRYLLEKTKEFVEDTYTIGNGYDHDAQVIYGDTDSVMVKFGFKTVKETFPIAIEAAEKASKIFPDPILLEFEKVYFPYLLM